VVVPDGAGVTGGAGNAAGVREVGAGVLLDGAVVGEVACAVAPPDGAAALEAGLVARPGDGARRSPAP
jgi:hypothetical protein